MVEQEVGKKVSPFSVILVAIQVILIVIMYIVSQNFALIFQDFNVELPWMTKLLTGQPLLAALAPLCVGVLAVAKDFVTDSAAARRISNWSLLFITAVIVGVFVDALFSPLIVMINSVNGGK